MPDHLGEQGGGVVPLRQPRPQEHAALGTGPHRPGREGVREAREHGVPALAVDGGDAGDVGVQVTVGQVAGGGELVDGRGVQVGGLLGDRAGPAQLGGCPQPAQAQAGRHDLGEGAQQHGPVPGALVGGDPRHPLALEAQFAVRVVLDDPQAAPPGDLGDGGAAGGGHGAAGGVGEGGDRVEQLGPLAHHQLLQRPGVYPVLVPGHGHHPGAREAEGLERGQVAGAFDEDGVAGFEQGGGEERECLLRAGGDEDVVGVGGQPAGRGAGGEGGPQGGFALGRGVLQSPRGRLGEDVPVRGGDALRVEEFGGRQPAREVDHLGAGGDGEDVPYGRTADRPGPRGERRQGSGGGGHVLSHGHVRSVRK